MRKQIWACLGLKIGVRKRPLRLTFIKICVIACGLIFLMYWKLIVCLKVSYKPARNIHHVNCDHLLTNLTQGKFDIIYVPIC